MEVINFRGKDYPGFQRLGFASQYAFPFAEKVCIGIGVDVGCNREEWKFPGAIAIDPAMNDYHATKFPILPPLNYIFSSHCLEHIPNWVEVLDYWTEQLMVRGVVFLYLPAYSQEYWRPFHNRKHLHAFNPELMRDYFESSGRYHNIFCSGIDLYDSFMIMAERLK